MNRRERTVSPVHTCDRRLYSRAPYRNRSLSGWKEPDLTMDQRRIQKFELDPDKDSTSEDARCDESRDGDVALGSCIAQLDTNSEYRESLHGKQTEEKNHLDSPMDKQHRMQTVYTVPRRSRRRSLVHSFANSSISDTAVSSSESSTECQDSGCRRSASLPPLPRLSLYHSKSLSGRSVDSEHNSLSAFLSLKKNQASLSAALAAFEGKPTPSDSSVSSVILTEERRDDEDDDPNPISSPTAMPTVSMGDQNSDSSQLDKIFHFHELSSKHDQFPEHFQSCSASPCISITHEHQRHIPALQSSDCSLSLMHRLRSLSEYTLCSTNAALASCDNPTTTLIKYFRSTPQCQKAHRGPLSQIGMYFDPTLKPDEKPDTTKMPDRLSVDAEEIQTRNDCGEKTNSFMEDEDEIEVNHPDAGTCTETDVKDSEGEIDFDGGFYFHGEIANRSNITLDSMLPYKSVCITGKERTPSTSILDQHGWSHYHRYARHRLSSSEDAPLKVLPLNHISRALVVSEDANKRQHGLVESDSAKDLTELMALTDELHKLRHWKAIATKSLQSACEDAQELDSLRATRANDLERMRKLQLELDKQKAKVSLLTSILNSNGENLTSTHYLESGISARAVGGIVSDDKYATMTEGQTLDEMNSDAQNVHNVVQGGKLLNCEDNLESVFNGALLNESSKYKSMLLSKEEEICSLRLTIEQMTQKTSQLESTLDASNQAKDLISDELRELKVWNATTMIRLEVEQKARKKGNQKLEALMHQAQCLQEQMARRESDLIEMQNKLETCQQLDRRLKMAEDLATEKQHEVSSLSACVQRLQNQMRDSTKSLNKLVREHRTENQQLKLELLAKENELSNLKDNLEASVINTRKLQNELDMLGGIYKQKEAENANPVELDCKSSAFMNSKSMQIMVSEKQKTIEFLQDSYEEQKEVIDALQKKIIEFVDDRGRTEQLLLELADERNSLKVDSASKSAVISDLMTRNNQLLRDMNKLTLQKTSLNQQGTIASETFEQRIKELERELDRERLKNQSATEALAGMEAALVAVERHRKKLLQN